MRLMIEICGIFGISGVLRRRSAVLAAAFTGWESDTWRGLAFGLTVLPWLTQSSVPAEFNRPYGGMFSTKHPAAI